MRISDWSSDVCSSDLSSSATGAVSRRTAMDFIEQGICLLDKDPDGFTAVVDEQLVLIAACNYFRLHTYQWDAVAHAAGEPSSMGFQFERSLMLFMESGLISLFADEPRARKSVVVGKSGLVRVDPGGGR